MNYYNLVKGDTIQDGDEFKLPRSGRWEPVPLVDIGRSYNPVLSPPIRRLIKNSYTKHHYTDANSYIYPSGDYKGLTKREHFASLAMKALIAGGSNGTEELIAISAVMQADALIAALNSDANTSSSQEMVNLKNKV